MAATAESLQQQVETLRATCPVLCPSIIPRGYDTNDLVGLVQGSGREALEDFEKLVDGAATNVSACCVCGADGAATVSDLSSDGEGEETTTSLSFTLFTEINFKERSIELQKAGFACQQCRALRSTCRVVRYAALRVGGGGASHGGGGGEQAAEQQQRLLALAAHLAATNRAPHSLQANPEALAVWLQELYCRAYALQVVASNLGGWKAVGPDGQPLKLSRGKDVVAAAQVLLGGRQQAQKQKQKLQRAPPEAEAEAEEQPRRKKARQAAQLRGQGVAVKAAGAVEAVVRQRKGRAVTADGAAASGARQQAEAQELRPAKKLRAAGEAGPRAAGPAAQNGAAKAAKAQALEQPENTRKPSSEAAPKAAGKAKKGDGKAAAPPPGPSSEEPQRKGKSKAAGEPEVRELASAPGRGGDGAGPPGRPAVGARPAAKGAAGGATQREGSGRGAGGQAPRAPAGKGQKVDGGAGAGSAKAENGKVKGLAAGGMDGAAGKKAKKAKKLTQ